MVLRNTPTLSAGDRALVASLGSEELTEQEFRAILEAHRRGRVDNASMRALTGLDTLAASRLLVRLRDRGILTLHGAGSASFYTLGPAMQVAAAEDQGELGADGGGLGADRGELGTDRGELGTDRGGLGTDRGELGMDRGELPEDLQRDLAALGPRPRAARLRPLIVRVCALRPWKPAEFAAVLGFKRHDLLVERHLKPMCDDGLLERTFPDTPSHPAYGRRSPAILCR